MVAYIAGMAGSGVNGYFVDQNGNPKLWRLEQAWAVPWNAGRWNGLTPPANWQSDMDAYFQARGPQGITAWMGTAWGNTQVDSTLPFTTGGRTWDGVYPLIVNGTAGAITTGSETISLNNTFWTRIDYLLNSALTNGVACFLNLGMSYDFSDAGGIWQHLSTTQANTFGGLIAARYPQASYPHLHWFWGDDCGSGGQDSFFSAMLTGIQGTGDTRNVRAMEQLPGTNCHIEFDTGAVYVPGGFGMTSTTYNWNYIYAPCYVAVEDSY